LDQSLNLKDSAILPVCSIVCQLSNRLSIVLMTNENWLIK
jgi:hypothetical protein